MKAYEGDIPDGAYTLILEDYVECYAPGERDSPILLPEDVFINLPKHYSLYRTNGVVGNNLKSFMRATLRGMDIMRKIGK